MDEGQNWLSWGVVGLVTLGILYVGTRFPPVLTATHIFACIGLILVVLLQSGRAADLAGAFGGAGSQTAFGPRGAATFLSKATTFLAVVFMLTSLTLAVYYRGAGSQPLPDTTPGAAQEAPAESGDSTGAETPSPADSEPAGETPGSEPPPAPEQ